MLSSETETDVCDRYNDAPGVTLKFLFKHAALRGCEYTRFVIRQAYWRVFASRLVRGRKRKLICFRTRAHKHMTSSACRRRRRRRRSSVTFAAYWLSSHNMHGAGRGGEGRGNKSIGTKLTTNCIWATSKSFCCSTHEQKHTQKHRIHVRTHRTSIHTHTPTQTLNL